MGIGIIKKLLFCSYFLHISLCFYSNFDRESSLDVELNSTSNKYPIGILLTDPATPKIRNTWKMWWWHHTHIMISSSPFSGISFWGVVGSIKSMPSGYSLDVELIPHPTSSPDRNLSKNIGRYVKNTNKKVVFFFSSSKIKKCYFIILTIILLVHFRRPILSWNFL